MKQRAEFIQYSKYLNAYYEDDQILFLKFKKETELSHIEKNLLRSRVLLQEKKFDEAVQLLENIKTEVHFLKAEKYLMLSTSYLLKCDFEESSKFGNLAIRYYEELNDKIGMFKTYYNISVAFQRLGMNSLARYYTTQAQKHILNHEHFVMIERMRASFMLNEGQYLQAISLLEDVFNEHELTEYEKEIYQILLCEGYVKSNQLETAFLVSKKLINSKKLMPKARMVFNYHLLKILQENCKLPEKPEAIQKSEEFNLKWDILEAIQMGEHELYISLWKDLAETYPNYYGKLGECIDESESVDIFNRALQSFLADKKNINYDLAVIKGKKAQVLLQELLNSDTPLRKEILIERIWGVSYEVKYNARFYKLIERLKQSTGIEIKNSNNAYFIAA